MSNEQEAEVEPFLSKIDDMIYNGKVPASDFTPKGCRNKIDLKYMELTISDGFLQDLKKLIESGYLFIQDDKLRPHLLCKMFLSVKSLTKQHQSFLNAWKQEIKRQCGGDIRALVDMQHVQILIEIANI